MQGDAPELEQVLGLLDHVRREWYASRVLGGLLLFLALALGLTLLFIGIETFLAPSPTIRWCMLALLAAIVVAAGVLLVGRRLVENPSDEQIALLVEATHPELHNELINAVRLTADSSEQRRTFVRAAIRESDRKARDLKARGVVDWRRVKRNSFAATALIILWAVLIFMAPARVANALTRMLMPTANIEKVGSVRIVSVVPGNTTVSAGDNLVVEAILEGPTEDAMPRLQHFTNTGSVHEEPMIKAEANRFACELLDIKTPRMYRVVVADSRSRDYKISVTERPLVTRISARYVYPKYTRRPAETVADTGGRIQALKGTRAFLTISSNKRLKSAQLLLDGLEPMLFGLAQHGASATTRRMLSITENRSGVIEIVDEFKCKNSHALHVVARKDQPPQVKVVAPGEDRTLAVGEALELAIRGSDDYGVVRAELVEKRLNPARNTSGEPKTIQTWHKFSDCKNVPLNRRWNFEKKSYKNGEIIRYFVRMIDGNEVDGPGVGTSAEFTVRLEDVQARRKEREKKFSNWQAELEKVLQQQKQLRKMTDKLKPSIPAKGTDKNSPDQ